MSRPTRLRTCSLAAGSFPSASWVAIVAPSRLSEQPPRTVQVAMAVVMIMAKGRLALTRSSAAPSAAAAPTNEPV